MLITAVILLMSPLGTWAHEIEVDCTVLGSETVRVTACYVPDDPIAGASVRVLDPQGTLVAEGYTDAQGMFLYHPSAALAYTFEIVAAGHIAVASLTAEQAEQLRAGPLDGRTVGAENEVVRPSD